MGIRRNPCIYISDRINHGFLSSLQGGSNGSGQELTIRMTAPVWWMVTSEPGLMKHTERIRVYVSRGLWNCT